MRALLFLVFLSALHAQTPAAGTVQANGSATIRVTPDQAELSVSVVTQATTAQEAGQQNAAQAAAMINALKTVIGSAGTVQTTSYYLSPRTTPPNGQIVGYTASNTVAVTTTNLGILGTIIDTANQSGGTNVSGISFGLQDPEPAKQQALTKASQQALAHATAMATGLGRKTGAVVSALESSSYAPVVANGGIAVTATPTPVQTGTVTVSANVVVTVQLSQ